MHAKRVAGSKIAMTQGAHWGAGLEFVEEVAITMAKVSTFSLFACLNGEGSCVASNICRQQIPVWLPEKAQWKKGDGVVCFWNKKFCMFKVIIIFMVLSLNHQENKQTELKFRNTDSVLDDDNDYFRGYTEKVSIYLKGFSWSLFTKCYKSTFIKLLLKLRFFKQWK